MKLCLLDAVKIVRLYKLVMLEVISYLELRYLNCEVAIVSHRMTGHVSVENEKAN
jgi:hypothetical protein